MTCQSCGHDKPIQGRGMCAACYRRWRRQDPEVAEHDRAVSRAWKERNREINRARDRVYSEFYRRSGACSSCGGPAGHQGMFCLACWQAKADERRSQIVEMYDAGVPLREMAEVIGTTLNALSVDLDRLRKAGRIGYRYAAYRERVR